MKLTKKIEAEIKKVMNDYWDSYFDGDLETWASYLPDHYQNIGTTEEEIWKSKQDIVDYTNRVFDQMVGMADMRNKEVQIIPFDPHVMVHELGDVYIKTNDGWSFYAKLRLSSLLENNGNGWKILHQHGSYPDSKVEEGETFAFDKISKENQELREAVKRRTLELENKNRELEIETALERIRAQSMLMQRSKELDATSKIFHEQLVSLGIDSEFSYVWLPDVENKTHKFWAAWTEKKKDSELIKSESFIYDLDKNEPYTAACFEAWESDQVVHVVPVAPEEVEHFFSVWSELLSGAESLKASNFPDGLYYAEAYMKYGCFGINIERRITEDEQEILRRFTVEFERTYTRFLNLQKAEEQAREADIELALEKVRSRSLAMHHTSEIQEIIHTLHEELLKLNISIAGGSFVVINKDIDSQLRAWGAGGTADTVSEVTIPHFGKAFSGDIIKGIRQGPGFFTEEFTHQQKISYFTELFKHEPWSELPDKQKKDVLESEDGYTRSCCVSSHTSIFIINQNGRIFSEEENNILKRFAKVFEQSYTRFLDLQKAEKQAREAEIELALERVRAKTMAMQHSDELMETSELMFEQIKGLDIELWSCGFSLWYDDDSYFVGYNPGPDGKMGEPLKIPLTEDIFFKTIREAKRRGDEFLVFESEGESLEQTYRYMDTLPVVGETMRGFVEAGYPLPTYQVTHCGFFSNGHLMFITQEQNPEAIEVFKRFTKVFNQTYTRFLDLQKAEEQAREAQIELSLERIRAQVTSMQESSDLLDIVVTMRTEFVKLDHEAHYFWHMRWLPNHYKKAMTSGDGTKIGMVMTLPRHIHGDIEPVAEWEKSNEPTHILAMEPDMAVDYIDKMITLGDFERVDPQAPTLNDIRKIGGLSFIMARTTHGEIGYSLPGVVPDPPEEAVETLVRFAGVFDLAYKRFEDLKTKENQHREAQIELALEKVRSRAMGMQSSDELNQLIGTLFTELTDLELQLTRCIIGIFETDTKACRWWLANSEDPLKPNSFHIPYHEAPAYQAFLKAWKKRKPKYEYLLKGSEKEEWDEYLFTETGLSQLPDLVKKGMKKPESVILSQCYNNFGFLHVASLEPLPEDHFDVLLRFAKVFDLTYTRFNDLKQAEEQAREAEIELALERVRARTMAMQKSDELVETSFVLFEQFNALGEFSDQISIGLFDETEKFMNLYSTLKGDKWNEAAQIDLKEPVVMTKIFKAWKEKKKSLVLDLSGDALKSYNKFRKSLSDLQFAEDRWLIHVAFFSQGVLTFSASEAHSKKTIRLLERFAKVFEQTYTRFLDLQKAEARAREAQIEAALERVRSRSMAMHNTEELQDVVRVVAEGLKNTGVILDTGGAVICTYFQDSKDVIHWTASEDETHPSVPYYLPYFEDELFDEAWASKNRGDDYYAKEFSFEVKNNFWKYAFEHSDYRQLPDEYKEIILESKTHGLAWAWSKNSAIMIPSIQGDLPSEEEKKILVRFANVFEQAYTRFLDLKKAEAQAREAKIETALEKVRSRTMGMRSSDELPEVANLLFLEVQELGIPAWSCGYNILSDDKKSSTCFMSSEGEIQTPFTLPLSEHESLRPWHQAIVNDEAFFVYAQGGDELAEHYKYMKSLPELTGVFQQFEDAEIDLPMYQVNHLARFTHGFLLFITYQPVPDAHDIFKRFTNVFEQTYTRFLDLKKAEERARQAQIEASLERVRAKAMSMQNSDALDEVLSVLCEQFDVLGILPVSTHMTVFNFDNNTFTLRETGKYGDRSFGEQTVDLDAMDTWKETVDKWKADKATDVNKLHFPKETLPEVWEVFHESFASMPEESRITSDDYPDGIYHTAGKHPFGYIGMNQTRPATEEEEEIVIKFANEFGRAYQRFLDLQKAEEQAKEAQIELSLERIRAQVTSMQESSDLFDIVVSMREEFLTLGHEADSFWHMRWLPDVYEMSMTSEDGQRLGMVIKVPKFVHDQIPGLPEWEKGNDPIYVLALDADDAWDYIENMNTHGQYEQIDSNAPTKEDIEHIGGLTFILARTSHGEIGFSLPGVVPDPPEEALETLTRFASVFDLAYTRFEDLKESERRHREVEIDLALEKVRSRSIDMRKTSELEDVILMVNEQFRNLNVHMSGGAFIVINEKLKEGFYCWGAGGAGDYVQEVFIPILDRPISTNIAENIKKGTKFFTEHYSNAEKKEFFRHLFNYPPFSETPPERKKELLELPDGYVRSCAVSEQTSIFIVNHHERVFTEDENHILRQMSRVFEQAYTRFLDLKKASDQAQQISEERDRLEIALNELHATQAQLIQQEKLASLGQLTAGIAHEIKNPLNFVNNFSDLSVELVEETKEELTAISDQLSAEDQEKVDQALEILNDIDMNLRKIYEHGSRADSIVKSMLEHSRGGTGKLEPTDLNALVKEFVNLSFHGMRAGKNPINVDMEFELDENIGEIPLIAEDFSRVIVNLCNNAFDAMREKGYGKDLQGLEDLGGLDAYLPKLTVRTKLENGKVVLEIEDNGPGIPEEMKDKIMQPFFTTKKGTEGTGLGLSITNDIVKAHGGELNVSSKGNEGTKFSIQLKKD
ncbi:MAG: ATP-binding protein [Balneola sp.]